MWIFSGITQCELHIQYRSKVSNQSRLVSRETRVASLETRLERRDSRLARITEAEILEYYRISREKKTTEFLAHLSCDAFIRAIFKTRPNVFALEELCDSKQFVFIQFKGFHSCTM